MFVLLIGVFIHTSSFLLFLQRQYIKYPENPNTNVKEKIQELGNEKQRMREQRLAYTEQLRSLQEAAERSSNDPSQPESVEGRSWWRRTGRWIVGSNKGSE
jgi:hypothetical protein